MKIWFSVYSCCSLSILIYLLLKKGFDIDKVSDGRHTEINAQTQKSREMPIQRGRIITFIQKLLIKLL